MNRIAQKIEQIATVFLFLFVLLQPISIAGAFIAYSFLALAWLIRLMLAPKLHLYRSPLDFPILIYWVLCALSALVSPLPASSWEGMRKVDMVFLAIVVAHNIPSVRRAKQLLAVLFLGTLVSVAYAGWQFVAGVGLHVRDLRQDSVLFRAGIRNDDVILRVDNQAIRRPDKFLSYLGSKTGDKPERLLIVHDGGFDVLKDAVAVEIPPGALPHSTNAADWGVNLQTEKLARARSFYSHPVTYAMILESLGCLVFGLWLGLHRRLSPATSLALMGLWIILALALGATLTRSAWLSFAFGCLAVVWLHDRRHRVRVILPLLLILAAMGTNTAIHRWRGVGLVDLNDPGTQYRMEMWKEGLKLAETHPWFGVGMNTIRDSPSSFVLEAESKYNLWSHFHSTPIQLAVMQGFPVLFAWFAMMGCYLVLLVRLVRKALEQENWVLYAMALGLLGGAIAFLASSAVQYNFGDSVVALQFWFFVGLALALNRQLLAETKLAGSTS
ncbi:MAG TPA: O-antigen ligase family protein [Terriglobia bacterium]|nr:O-antigen ligase family protein [Terriglobia bacterium]